MPFAEYFEQVWGFPLAGPPGSGVEGSLEQLLVVARELLEPTRIAPRDARRGGTVQFPGLDGVVPGFGRQTAERLGPRLRAPRRARRPHWTGARNSPRTFGHFGRSGTFLWVDPDAGLALACLTDRTFGDWAKEAWPRLSDAVLEAARV